MIALNAFSNVRHSGNVDAAMKTALHLTDYDDILDPLEIFSLLGKYLLDVLRRVSSVRLRLLWYSLRLIIPSTNCNFFLISGSKFEQ